jgi:hypothetical protein
MNVKPIPNINEPDEVLPKIVNEDHNSRMGNTVNGKGNNAGTRRHWYIKYRHK